MSSLTYRDAAGVAHEVVVRTTATGFWEVIDSCAHEDLVIECLNGRVDGEAQADAIAAEYVTAGRFVALAGGSGGEAISEQGGADAHSDRRSRHAARSRHARGPALSSQAG
jgi:hypothetical protein